ncbi:MAG: ribosome maturation factor RimM [Lachnospiraceae bacterium]|nr:ribosome maturation factor RimM [Lachnospiraceae bacterium]
MEDYFRVGVIVRTHGIRGEVKVYPTTDDVSRFSYLKDCFIDNGGKLIPVTVPGAKFFKQFVILKFKGIDDINEVEKYKGRDILVSRENAVPLEEDEYYIADVIGFDVVTKEGEVIGKLADVMQTGANDVLAVTTAAGKEILIPVIDDCVHDFNMDEKKIVVTLLPGLADL